MVQTVRTMKPQRSKFDEIEWGEAAMQESAWDTPLATADINVNQPRTSQIVFINRDPETVGDDEVGYGDGWPRNDVVNRQPLNLEGLSYRLSSEMAMLFVALGLGKVVTVDNEDTSFAHTFTPQDPNVARVAGNGGYSQAPHTSFRYKTGVTQAIAHSVCLNTFEIAGAPAEYPSITAGVMGNGNQTPDANPFSAVGSPSRMRLTKVQVGVATDEEDISAALRDVTFGWNNNLVVDDAFVPGSGIYKGQLFYAQREAALSMVFDQNNPDVELAAQLAQTAQKAILTYEGDIIAGINKHHMIVTLPLVRIGTRSEEDRSNRRANNIEYKIRADGSGDYITIEVQNTVADTVLDISP